MLRFSREMDWGEWASTAPPPAAFSMLPSGEVLAVSGSSGGLKCFSLTGTITQQGNDYSSPLFASQVKLHSLDIAGQEKIFTTGYYFQDALIYDSPTATPRAAMGSSGLIGDLESVTIGTDCYVYSVGRGAAGVVVWKVGNDGTWTKIQEMEDPRWDRAGALCDLVQSGSYLFAASPRANTITSLKIKPDGTLEKVGALDSTHGLLVSRPSAMASVEMGGDTYLIVGASGSSSLSVVKLLHGGAMQVVDQINDKTDTFFAGVNHLETFTAGGKSYVLASGGEKGLSIFTLLPDGRLHHVSSIADTATRNLDGICTTQVIVSGSSVEILVSSRREMGVTKFCFDIETGGLTKAGTGAVTGGAGNDILQGIAGTHSLSGGAGDDILIDGPGATTLSGGAGRDHFYISDDGMRNVIADFELGVDQIDLSAWGLSSRTGLIFTPTADGIEIRYGDNILEVRSANGQQLAASQMTHETLFAADRPDITNRPATFTDPNPPTPIAAPPNPAPVPPFSPLTELSGPPMPGLPPPPIPNVPAYNWNHVQGSDSGQTLTGGSGNDMLLAVPQRATFDKMAGEIVRAYQAAFGRTPDEGEFGYWCDKIRGGGSRYEMVEVLLASDEFKSGQSAPDNSAYITSLFQNLLGRAPTGTEATEWLRYMASTEPRREAILTLFADSEAAKSSLEPEVMQYVWGVWRAGQTDEVYRAYSGIVGRAPDLAGLQEWTGKLADGIPHSRLIEDLMQSPEFQATYGGKSDRQFVDLLHENLQGRASKPTSFKQWIDKATAEVMPRAGAVVLSIESHDYASKTAPAMKGWMRSQSGGDTLIPGGGNNVAVGGMMADTFQFSGATPGKTRISDFEPWDYVKLTGMGYSSGSDALRHLRQQEEDVIFSDGGVEITFSGTSLSDFEADHFLIA